MYFIIIIACCWICSLSFSIDWLVSSGYRENAKKKWIENWEIYFLLSYWFWASACVRWFLRFCENSLNLFWNRTTAWLANKFSKEVCMPERGIGVMRTEETNFMFMFLFAAYFRRQTNRKKCSNETKIVELMRFLIPSVIRALAAVSRS